MLKILRNEFCCRRTLQPILMLYQQCYSKKNVAQIGLYNLCHSSQFYFRVYSDFFKQNAHTHSILCNSSVKSLDEIVIDKHSGNVTGKKFVESETIYHHKVLEELSVYANTLFKQDISFNQRYRLSHEEFKKLINTENWSNESSYNVALAFASFGIYSNNDLMLTIDDELFNDLSTAFVNKCSQFTDEQLIDCMIALQFWPQSNHVKETNYLKIWKKIDDVCLERYLDWTFDRTLYMMDLWYHMKLIRLSNFVYKGLNRVSRKCKDLTRPQMIQLLFYMSCTRKLHPHISFREYEHYLQKHITHLTIEEIGVFTLAFFKTKTAILNEKLLLYTMQRVVEEVKMIPEVTLTAIAKTLRFSHKPGLAFTLNDMVQKVVEERMSSLKLLSCIHIAHISSKLHFYNEHTLTKLAEKFCENPLDARLKDMERVAFLLSLFNYIPPTTPDILNIMVQQLDLPQHVAAEENHPLALVSLVYFLTILKTYPEKHIKHVLSQEFLNKHFENKFMTPIQILQIDYNRVLEGSEGSEHLLSPAMREYLARKNSKYVPDLQYGKLSNFDQMMLEVKNLTKEALGGEEYCLVCYTLPHFPRADIIFRLDSEGRPMPIPEELRLRKPFEDVLRPTGDGWRCVVVANRNMYMLNIPRLVGEPTTKLRQLRLLGYTPIVIPYHYWMSEKNKVDYLKLKYFTTPR